MAMAICFRNTKTVMNIMKSMMNAMIPKHSQVFDFCKIVLMNGVELGALLKSDNLRLSKRSYCLKEYSPPNFNKYSKSAFSFEIQIQLFWF